MKNLDIIELFIDESNLEDGIDAISLVESPAIEENFVALSKHKVEFKTIDSEKRIIVGLALVPDKLIYRRKGDFHTSSLSIFIVTAQAPSTAFNP